MEKSALIESFLSKAQHKAEEISNFSTWKQEALKEIYHPSSNFPGTFWLASFLEMEKTEHLIKWRSYLNDHSSISTEADIVHALKELIAQKQELYRTKLLPETKDLELQLQELKLQKMSIQKEKEHEKEKSNKDKVMKLAQEEENLVKKIETQESQILQHHSVSAQCRAMIFLLKRL